MRFFYSGAPDFLEVQGDPRISLGGNRSSTVVPNNSLSNVFDAISLTQERQGSELVRGLFLVNELGVDLQNLYAYFTYDTPNLATFEFAVVTTNGERMEQIGNSHSTPYVGTFVSADGVANKVLVIPTLLDGQVIGVWFKRVVVATPATACQVLYDEFIADPQPPPPATQETAVFHLEWD